MPHMGEKQFMKAAKELRPTIRTTASYLAPFSVAAYATGFVLDLAPALVLVKHLFSRTVLLPRRCPSE